MSYFSQLGRNWSLLPVEMIQPLDMMSIRLATISKRLTTLLPFLDITAAAKPPEFQIRVDIYYHKPTPHGIEDEHSCKLSKRASRGIRHAYKHSKSKIPKREGTHTYT